MNSVIGCIDLFDQMDVKIKLIIKKNEVKTQLEIALRELKKSLGTDLFPRNYSNVLKLVSKDTDIFNETTSELILLAKNYAN